VAFWRIIVAKHRHWTNDLHALHLGLNQYQGVSLVRRRIAGVRDAEYDVYSVARVPRSGDPLDNISLDHVMVWAGLPHPFVA
jgi:hypothetical protein